MPTCEQCGNDYDKAFQVTMAGRTMTFDSFECAIQAHRADLRPLRRAHRRARGRGGRRRLLLRALRQAPGRDRGPGPGLNSGAVRAAGERREPLVRA